MLSLWWILCLLKINHKELLKVPKNGKKMTNLSTLGRTNPLAYFAAASLTKKIKVL
jgi:hypothetical protein